MHALLTAAFVALFAAILYRSRLSQSVGVPPIWVVGAFLIKLLAGFAVWAIYTYHYEYRGTSDAFRYFDNGMILHGFLREDPALYLRLLTGIGMDHPDVQAVLDGFNGWNKSYNYGIPNDNPTIIRINAFIALFSQGYYHVHTAFMCLFSTLGTLLLLRGVRAWMPGRERILFLALFLCPSVLFWSSGVLKEAPMLLFLGGSVGGVLYAFKQGWTTLRACAVVGCLLGLVVLKMYVLIALIPGLLTWWTLNQWKGKGRWWKVLGVHGLCALLALNASWIYPPGDALYILSKKQTDFYNTAALMNAGSTIELPPIEGVGSVLKAFPTALYTTYFRPDVTEVKSTFYAGLAVENAVLLLLLLWAIGKGKWSTSSSSMRWFLLSFVILYGWMVGLTVPILGAIVRYKIAALPFVIILALSGGTGLWLELRLRKQVTA